MVFMKEHCQLITMWQYIVILIIICVGVSIYRRKRINVVGILEEIGIIIHQKSDITLKINDYDIVCNGKISDLTEEFLKGSVGFIESYMAVKWSCKDLKQLLEKINNANLDTMKHYTIMDLIELGVRRLLIEVKGLSRSDNKLVALQHYDLPLILYSQMLDRTMSYSCGYFKDVDDLEQAQINKIELIAQKMHLKSGMKVLDIGCGWGSLAHYMAKQYDVEVVGVTISKEQYHYCEKTHNHPNLRFDIMDYRDIGDEQFDRIVSVGMFEHVTSKNYDEFFKVCQRSLKPTGLILLHTITGNKSHRPGEGNAFISKYIFPNSQLPSLMQITEAVSYKFIVEDVHSFGLYYAKTLEKWRSNFDIVEINRHLRENDLDELSIEFIRMWEAYLIMSQIGFESRKINLHQFVLSRGLTEVYEAVR